MPDLAGTWDGDALREQISEGLAGEWPHTFCDGFQDAVASYVAEIVTQFFQKDGGHDD